MNAWLKQSWLVLLLAGSLGTALAVVEQSLQGRIAQNARDRLERAVLDVVPGGVRSEELTTGTQPEWRVFDDQDSVIGRAYVAETAGFADRIRLMVGVSIDGSKLRGVAVLESRETPGLGERIREPDFLAQFADRPTDIELTVVKPGQSAEQPIDAISGATISSKAVAGAVNECVSRIADRPAEATSVDAVVGGEQ